MRLSPGSTAAIAILGIFTVFINWRAKSLEIGSRWKNEQSALVGKPAPEFSLESLDGRKVSLADYRGKTLAVTFWASWCGPCRMEMPVLIRFYRQTHDSGSNFEILAISIDDNREDAQDAARAMKIPFPVLLDSGSHLADTYKVEGIPMLFVIDKSGKVSWSHTGFQIGLDYLLARDFDIKNYSPMVNKP